MDHRLLRGDEIHYVDGINVVGATHRRVISLMGNAALAGQVALGIFRNPARPGRKLCIFHRAVFIRYVLKPVITQIKC